MRKIDSTAVYVAHAICKLDHHSHAWICRLVNIYADQDRWYIQHVNGKTAQASAQYTTNTHITATFSRHTRT